MFSSGLFRLLRFFLGLVPSLRRSRYHVMIFYLKPYFFAVTLYLYLGPLAWLLYKNAHTLTLSNLQPSQTTSETYKSTANIQLHGVRSLGRQAQFRTTFYSDSHWFNNFVVIGIAHRRDVGNEDDLVSYSSAETRMPPHIIKPTQKPTKSQLVSKYLIILSNKSRILQDPPAATRVAPPPNPVRGSGTTR